MIKDGGLGSGDRGHGHLHLAFERGERRFAEILVGKGADDFGDGGLHADLVAGHDSSISWIRFAGNVSKEGHIDD
jgi:hypothetical protein